jgi:CheY-like chemotaxis protein
MRSGKLNLARQIEALATIERAYVGEIDQKRAMQAGFQMHLTKPLEPEQFVCAIVSLLQI